MTNKEKCINYYHKNREKMKKSQKIYRQNNKDRISKQKQKWYYKNREKILEKSKKYNQDNKAKIQNRKKKYYENWIEILKKLLDCEIIKCQECGFDKYFKSIDFHHRNPKEKTHSISTIMKNKPTAKRIKILKKELEKCDILCKNCHYGLYH